MKNIKKITGWSILALMTVSFFTVMGFDIGFMKMFTLVGILAAILGLLILAISLITGEL